MFFRSRRHRIYPNTHRRPLGCSFHQGWTRTCGRSRPRRWLQGGGGEKLIDNVLFSSRDCDVMMWMTHCKVIGLVMSEVWQHWDVGGRYLSTTNEILFQSKFIMRSLTDDWVDVLRCVLSKRTDTGTFSWHSKAGQRPLAVHILTNHRAHLPNTSQSVEGRGRNNYRVGLFTTVQRHRHRTGRKRLALRRAAVQFGVLECKDVNGAFVAGGTQERRVMAEVDAGGKKTKQTGRMVVISGFCSHVDTFLLPLGDIRICSEPIHHWSRLRMSQRLVKRCCDADACWWLKHFDTHTQTIHHYLSVYQYRVAGSVPLRSSTSLSLVVVSNRRISVPLREAEAATLPGWLSATQAISLWWALMVKGADDVPGLVLDKSCK